MQRETVAIPLAAGIKPISRARTLELSNLLTAHNCQFIYDQGPQKRFGHLAQTTRTNDAPVGLDGIELPGQPGVRTTYEPTDPGLSDYWLHGYGLFSADSTATTGANDTSNQPRAGHLFGSFQRDNEHVVWDGFRLFSQPDLTTGVFGTPGDPAVMPAMRVSPIAKSSTAQEQPDAAENGVLRTVAWIDDTGQGVYSVYNTRSGACVVNEGQLTSTTCTGVRVFTLGPWTHILNHDTVELYLDSFHQDNPTSINTVSVGAVDDPCFDVRKVSETRAVIGRINTEAIEITVIKMDGSPYVTYTADIDSMVPERFTLAVNREGVLGIAWSESQIAELNTPSDVYFRTYSLTGGSTLSASLFVTTTEDAPRLTLADNYLRDSSTNETSWTLFLEDTKVTSAWKQVQAWGLTETQETLNFTRYNMVLASHAFRVGQRAFVWCATHPSLFAKQPTWVLCDEQLLPVGKHAFGLAYIPDTDVLSWMPSVNWYTAENEDVSAAERFVFSGALAYRQRVETSVDSTDPNGVWAEPSINYYKLDFLPKLRYAQAGRCTYLAGAQLWAYDGTRLVEAGFHLGPEGVTGTTPDVGGNLTASKAYRYRVDLCEKNAQNEETRSLSFITDAINTDATNKKITLNIPGVPFTRRNSYFLVFRAEGDGTTYYLCSSRNPADAGAAENGYLANDGSAFQFTFVDNLSDANLTAREYHPANATGYLQPLGAPACETVACGRDRLWLAGGELAPGEIAPSRLFQPNETPSFSPAVNFQVDRNAEPITAVGFVGEVAAFFRRTSTYMLDSDGPDNTGQGAWGGVRLALADCGAVAQETVALAGDGLYFQSPAGIRVLTPGGGLRPPGAGLVGGLGSDVDTLAADGDYAAAVVVPKYSQVRWYSRDPSKPTLVVDYTKNIWTTWDIYGVGGVYWTAAGTAVVVRGNGELWTETEDRYTDGDRTYEMVVKTAWLRAANLGDFQRVYRWALFGEASDGLNLRYRLFYDERPYHGEEGTVQFIAADGNSSEWGDADWGGGSWGDSDNPVGESGLWFRDGVFRFRRRTARQKCSVFSIELSDQGSTTAFSPVVLALQLGRKEGLDRIR